MCAEIAACSGRQTKRGPVYIWHADIDEGARIAVDIATDFIPGVSHAKTAYDAYSRIQNGEDPVEVLAAAGADAALGLIPGLKAAKKVDKALDKAEKVADVADAAGDVADASKKVGRGGNKLMPDPAAQGPHSTFKRDPTTGKVTGHAEWTPNALNPHGFDQVKRVDTQYAHPHTDRGVPTPHTHEKSAPGGVRPAHPDELPR